MQFSEQMLYKDIIIVPVVVKIDYHSGEKLLNMSVRDYLDYIK